MELHFTVTPEDFIQASIYHNENSAMGKRLRWVVGAAGLLVTVLFMALICRGLYAIPVFAAILYILWWFLRSKKQNAKNLRRRLEREIGEGKYRESLGAQSLCLGEDKLRIVMAAASTEITYDSVARLTCDDARFYLYTGTTGNVLTILPFSAFADEDERQRFLALITEKAPQTLNPLR